MKEILNTISVWILPAIITIISLSGSIYLFLSVY